MYTQCIHVLVYTCTCTCTCTVHVHVAWDRLRGGWTRSRESEKNAIITFARANRDVDLSSSLPSLAALQFRMFLKSGRELEQRLNYCAIETVKSKPIHTER